MPSSSTKEGIVRTTVHTLGTQWGALTSMGRTNHVMTIDQRRPAGAHRPPDMKDKCGALNLDQENHETITPTRRSGQGSKEARTERIANRIRTDPTSFFKNAKIEDWSSYIVWVPLHENRSPGADIFAGNNRATTKRPGRGPAEATAAARAVAVATARHPATWQRIDCMGLAVVLAATLVVVCLESSGANATHRHPATWQPIDCMGRAVAPGGRAGSRAGRRVGRRSIFPGEIRWQAYAAWQCGG